MNNQEKYKKAAENIFMRLFYKEFSTKKYFYYNEISLPFLYFTINDFCNPFAFLKYKASV